MIKIKSSKEVLRSYPELNGIFQELEFNSIVNAMEEYANQFKSTPQSDGELENKIFKFIWDDYLGTPINENDVEQISKRCTSIALEYAGSDKQDWCTEDKHIPGCNCK